MDTETRHPPARAQRLFPRDGSKTFRTKRVMVVLVGTVLLALAILNEQQPPPAHGPLWGLLLAGAAFLYLWWLATLLFDLVFVWHRYIQHGVAMRFLRHEVKLAAKSHPDGPDNDPTGTAALKTSPTSPPAGSSAPRRNEHGQSENAGISG